MFKLNNYLLIMKIELLKIKIRVNEISIEVYKFEKQSCLI